MPALLQAVGVLQLALSEGYTRALRVHAQDVDGLLGTGEVQLQLGRLTGDILGPHRPSLPREANA